MIFPSLPINWLNCTSRCKLKRQKTSLPLPPHAVTKAQRQHSSAFVQLPRTPYELQQTCRPPDVCLASFLYLFLYTNFIRNIFPSSNFRPFCMRSRSTSSSTGIRSSANWNTCAVGWGTVLLAERSRVRFPTVSAFFIDMILPAAL
jgi:hypothetical protein